MLFSRDFRFDLGDGHPYTPKALPIEAQPRETISLTRLVPLLFLSVTSYGRTPAWDASTKEARLLRKFCTLLSRTDESDRQLLRLTARKMADQKPVS
jgi:hypothetical protein